MKSFNCLKKKNLIVDRYDSVTVDGQLRWQNELNEKNKAFFDISDGIFVNYWWRVRN